MALFPCACQRFELTEGRTIFRRDRTASKFSAGQWRITAGESKYGRFDAAEILMFRVDLVLDRLGDRRKNSIGKQDTQEGANQSRRDMVADFGCLSADGAHGDDNTQNRGNNAKARHGISGL